MVCPACFPTSPSCIFPPAACPENQGGSRCLQCCKFTFYVIAALMLFAMHLFAHMPLAPELLLTVLLGLSLVSQTQLGRQNDQVWLETALPFFCGGGTSLTLRTPCPVAFCHFDGLGWTALLGHCDCLDVVLSLRAYMGRNRFCLRRD